MFAPNSFSPRSRHLFRRIVVRAGENGPALNTLRRIARKVEGVSLEKRVDNLCPVSAGPQVDYTTVSVSKYDETVGWIDLLYTFVGPDQEDPAPKFVVFSETTGTEGDYYSYEQAYKAAKFEVISGSRWATIVCPDGRRVHLARARVRGQDDIVRVLGGTQGFINDSEALNSFEALFE